MQVLPPVPGCLRVDTIFGASLDNNIVVRNFWSYSGPAPNAAACLAMATTIMAAAASNLPALLSTQNSIQAVRVTDLSSASGGDATFVQFHAGTRAGGLLPASTCFLNSFTVGRRYRGGKPRS